MPRRQKVQTGTGQPYGQAGALKAAQVSVPLTNVAGPTAPQPGGSGTPPAGPAMTEDQIAAAFKSMPFPDKKLNDPTERPDEPITAGLGSFQAPAPPPEEDLDLAAMAPYLPALELMANQPSASIATRNYIRRLRGAAMTRNGPL